MCSVSLCPPGPHCFLLVIALDKPFIEGFQQAVRQHLELLGESVWCHTMVLFTCGDCLGDTTIEEHIESEGEALQWILERCEDRYHVLNNTERNNGTQVSDLLEKIEEMVEKSSQIKGEYYEMEQERFSEVLQSWKAAEERANKRMIEVQKQRATLRSLMYAQSSVTETSIVLLGAKLVGKSSAGNTILGREVFDAAGGTALCAKTQGTVADRQVTVVDTPGWWTNTTLDETPGLTKREIEFSVCLCPPGPLAFLLILNLHQPFKEAYQSAVCQHVELLGENAWSHTIVVFTYGECLGDAPIELHIENEGEALQWLVEKCGNRYHVLNNISKEDVTQVSELLEKIDEMVVGNRGCLYEMDRGRLQEIERRRTEQEKKANERMKKVQKQRQMLRSQMGEESHLSHLRIVLLGAKFAGKSSSGNIILGQEDFEAEGGTTLCAEAQGIVGERQVTVVDTPGWLTNVPLEDCPTLIRREIVFSVSLCPPGPHVFLLVVKMTDPFSNAESKAILQHFDLLSKNVWAHTLVLFTCEDSLGDATIEQHIECEGENLVSLVERCGNRYHVLNIMDTDDISQVSELLEKVEEMVMEHGGCHYEMDRERLHKITERRRADEERAEERKLKMQKQREALRSQMDDSSQQSELRIVLLGYKGFGKSSSANTILGREQFDIAEKTAQCVKGQGIIAGRQVTVVDTPGWLHEDPLHRTPRRTKREIVSSVSHCLPGPHAFLVVLRVAVPVSDADRASIQQHLEHVGESVWNHTIVLFTYGDCLGDATIEQYIECEEGSLQWLVDKCGNRYHVLNNDDPDDDSQVAELLERIDEMVAANGGLHYEIDTERLLEAEEMKNEEEENVEDRQMKVYKEKSTLKYVMGEIHKLPELSIILLGSRGAGKSLAVDTILGQRESDAVVATSMGVRTQALVAGRLVTVVDTPGWLADDAEDTPELTKREIVHSVLLCPPGPSCFLLAIDIGTFTEERRRAIQQHLELLGETVWRHTMVLFTYGDWLGDMTIEQHTESEGEALQWVIEQCGNRYHVLNNNDRSNDTQVTELLEKIEEMVARNRGRHYEMDRGLVEELEEGKREQQRRVNERVRKVQTQRETLRSLMEKPHKMSHLRIVVLGYKGSGITSSANTILGREGFDTVRRTSLCMKRLGAAAGRQVTVVDTPGWRIQHVLKETPELTKTEVAFSVTLCSPGTHAVLLVLRLDRAFREEHRKSFEEHVELLGKGVWSHTLVLFTCADRVGNPTVEQFIESEGEALQWVIEQCGNRYHVLNNNDRNDDTQVTELLEKIEEMVVGNNGLHYDMDRGRQHEIENKRRQQEEKAHEIMMKSQAERHMLTSQMGKPPQLSALRVVLLGCRSSGKSFAGNAILGRREYGTMRSAAQRVRGHRDLAGRQVTVVRSPGWGVEDGPDRPAEQTRRATLLHVLQCSPGPHALLLPVRVDMAFTDAHWRAVQKHLEPLGESEWRHTLVLFIRGECLGDAHIEQYIGAEGEALQGLVETCRNRYHVLRTDSFQDDSQVTELLGKIEGMVAENSECCFDTEQNVAVKFPEWRDLVGQGARVTEKGELERVKKQMEMEMAKSLDTPPLMGKEDRSISSDSSGRGTLESWSGSSARRSLKATQRSLGIGSLRSSDSRSVGQFTGSELGSRKDILEELSLQTEEEEDCEAECEKGQIERKGKQTSLESSDVLK
ncbi:hypothetical protein ACEWY4_006091 [Coilia grayii]|uniref:AIG1-type G domain-containing protein n=1 Tax=Coilia grayii TaxID=363190 RepID=A0ABD1KCG1_9TELE